MDFHLAAHENELPNETYSIELAPSPLVSDWVPLTLIPLHLLASALSPQVPFGYHGHQDGDAAGAGGAVVPDVSQHAAVVPDQEEDLHFQVQNMLSWLQWWQSRFSDHLLQWKYRDNKKYSAWERKHYLSKSTAVLSTQCMNTINSFSPRLYIIQALSDVQ